MGSVRLLPHRAEVPVEQRPDHVPYGRVTAPIQVGSLWADRMLRLGDLDREHVLRLVETGGEWPPLLVRKQDLRVIDGAHRLAAAHELGLETVEVELFDGSETEALVEALRRNASHGLPLTLIERKGGARQLLCARREWSDRMIGRLCGLAAGTVKSLRVAMGEGAPVVPLERRIGRDGRARPARPAEQRRRIVEALRANPGVPARVIAHGVGASPATVRAVSDALQPRNRKEPRNPEQVPEPVESEGRTPRPGRVEKLWASDTACASTDDSLTFAGWFDRTRIDVPTCSSHLASVPLSRVYEVADESRRRAQAWADFAAALQRRPGALLRSAALKETW
jgi:ParB-like chromosome segregation protein Spo0J